MGILLFTHSGEGQNPYPFFNERYDFFQGLELGYSILPKDSGGYFAIGYNASSTDKSRETCRVSLINEDGSLDTLKSYYGDSSYFIFALGNLYENEDGDYLFAGSSGKVSKRTDVTLMKFNPGGDTLWTETYGDTGVDEYGAAVVSANDGNGYMVLGIEDGPNGPQNDWKLTLYRVDSIGQLLWSKQYGSYQFDVPRTLNVTPDKGYVIGGKGQSYFPISQGSRSMVLKLDSNANKEWVRGFTARTDTSLDEGVLCATVTRDSTIAFATSLTDSIRPSGKRVGPWAAGELSLAGDTLWYKKFGPTIPMNSAKAIRELPNGDLVITGWGHSYVDSSGVDHARGFLMRLSAQGDSLWSRYLDPQPSSGTLNYHYLSDVRYTPEDSGFVAIGRFHKGDTVPTGSHQDQWIVKTNCAGFDSLPQADFTYSKDSSKGVAFEDSSRYATERYWSFGDGYFSNLKDPDHTYPDTSAYTVTLVSSACGYSDTVTKVVEPRIVKDTNTSIADHDAGTVGLEVRPNPTDGRFRVRYHLSSEKGKLKLYDSQGNPALTKKLPERRGYLSIDRPDLAPGLYLLKLRSAEGKTLHTRKVILER